MIDIINNSKGEIVKITEKFVLTEELANYVFERCYPKPCSLCYNYKHCNGVHNNCFNIDLSDLELINKLILQYFKEKDSE